MIDLFLYLLLGLIIVWFELTRKKYFLIDLITFFNFFFFLVYSFTPIAILLTSTDLIAKDMPYGVEYFGQNPFTSTIVFSSYLFFLAGYNITFNTKQKYNITFTTEFDLNFNLKILPFLYLILFMFFYIYISEFGGLKETIEQAQAYRSGALKYHQYGFLQKLFPLNTILLYYLYYKVVLQKSDKNRTLLLFFFILSLIFSILLTVIYNSRGFIIFEMVGLYVLTVMYYKNYFFKYLIVAVIVVIFIILFGRPLFNSMSDLIKYGFDTFLNNFLDRLTVIEQEDVSIISYFTHPIVSLEASLAKSGVDIELRYFKDIFYALISLLPNELLGFEDPTPLMQENTLILQGREHSTILPGILGFFSYSLHATGVFIGAFLYGAIGGVLYRLFIAFYEESKSSLIYIYLITLTYGYFVFRGSPTHALQAKFVLLIVLFIILFKSKIKISKIKP